ncbi:MAG: putative toxin-antitoxin system toxin component, PIN family [Acidobacteriaceae bacterium]|nr:putative toxin-antitoxin system toxin component, PIN family [Acidobacteriaceae bacterium]
MLRATLDTSILIAALVFKSARPLEILHMGLQGAANLTVSPAILDEMGNVLARDFTASPEEIAEARTIVADAARTATPAVQLDVIKEDPPDNRILECAMSAGADYIVTRDNDLLRRRTYAGIRIVNDADFLELARSEGKGR